MTLQDLLWAPPLLLAISVVLGAAGRHRPDEIRRTIRTRFVELVIGLALVGLFVRTIVTLFA